ncbi:hypothetical protein ERO13_D01G023493v2 [Gossypium hirsutum]|uniref:Uncharacterized protein n=3 Tax=Gossypium TaxID=3633 RepID=A0A1U8MFC2_GOSHI|nr:uncharacterized protein LOC107936109 [Gossypium hirsutum]KAB1671486.1 hypothetical protein [Gossypium barbadense]KAG4160864.1 hypothetical protein ERO13_D01G023493v2 [Gossypium hirsutum]TYG81772.1 hypothetical protein ES288_D01G032900v1 [Gossypium darwinii]
MPSHAFLFFIAVQIDPAGHHRRVCRFQTTNEVHYLVSAVVPAWCILVVPLLHRGTSLLLSTSPPSFDYGISRDLSPRKQLKEEAELLVEQLMVSVQYAAVSFMQWGTQWRLIKWKIFYLSLLIV